MVTISLPRNDYKYSSDKFELWHPIATTKDSDLLIICGDTIENPDHQKPIAFPVHRQYIAERALSLKENSLVMQGVKSKGDGTVIFDGFSAKSMFRYFRNFYFDKCTVTSSSGLVELFVFTQFMDDKSGRENLIPIIRQYLSKNLLKAIDVFGLMTICDEFDQTIIDTMLSQGSMWTKRSIFRHPIASKSVKLAMIKKQLKKATASICALNVDKMVKLVDKIGDKVESEALYYLARTWLLSCNNFSESERLLKSLSKITKSTQAEKYKFWKYFGSWANHHTPSQAAEHIELAFQLIFKSDPNVNTLADIDMEKMKVVATPKFSEADQKLVRQLSRKLSQVSIEKSDFDKKPDFTLTPNPKNSTVIPNRNVTQISEIRRFDSLQKHTDKCNDKDLPEIPEASITQNDDDPFFGDANDNKANSEAALSEDDPFAPNATSTEIEKPKVTRASKFAEEQVKLRFCLWKAGGIIGARGANIRELKEMNNCEVSLDGPRNSRELMDKLKSPSLKKKIDKLFTIEGKQKEVFEVVEKACEFIDYNGECKFQLLIEGKFMGCIVGKRGATINRLKEEYECKIFLDREGYKDSSEKLAKVIGETEKVFAVICEISDLLCAEMKFREARGESIEPDDPWFPTVPKEFMEGSDDEEEEEKEGSEEGSNSGKRSNQEDDEAESSPKKKAKTDDDDGGFF